MTRYGGIRLGDSHSGGGSMVEASGFPVNGINLCVIGDRGYCPTHSGTFPLVSTGNPFGFTLDGRPVVYEPAKLACGCSVISSCRDFFAWVDENDTTAALLPTKVQLPGTAAHGGTSSVNTASKWFLLRDSSTGAPLSNHPFMADVSGVTQHGLTDAAGYAQIMAATSTSVSIHAAFVAPKRSLTPHLGA